MLDTKSLQAIVGDAKEIIVYGFVDCWYQSLTHELNTLHYKTSYQDLFPLIKYDSGLQTSFGYNVKRQYKNILTSLTVENLKRSIHNEPLIYLIFCVASVDEEKSKIFDLQQIASSHNRQEPYGSITDSELRRCYKLYAQTSPDIKRIIETTFKFVKVKKNGDHLQLEELPPFWQNQSWQELWQKRLSEKSANVEPGKQFPWRESLQRHTRHFFQPSDAPVAEIEPLALRKNKPQ